MSVKYVVTEPTHKHVRETLARLKQDDPGWHIVGLDSKRATVFEHTVFGRVSLPATPRNEGNAIDQCVQRARKLRHAAEGHQGAILTALRSEFKVPDDGFVDAQFNVTDRVRAYVEERPDKHKISERALLQRVTPALPVVSGGVRGLRRVSGKNYLADGSDDDGTPQGTVAVEAAPTEFKLPDITDSWLAELLKSKRPNLGGDSRVQNHFEATSDHDRMVEIVGQLWEIDGMTCRRIGEYLAVPVNEVEDALREHGERERVEAEQANDDDNRIRVEVTAKKPTPAEVLDEVLEQRKMLLADPEQLWALEDEGKVPEWVDSALLKHRPTVCPNCGSKGDPRPEHPGIVSSGIVFECGVIYDDAATSEFKANRLTPECRRRHDQAVAAAARKEGMAMERAMEESVAKLQTPNGGDAGLVIPADVIGPLRAFLVGDMEDRISAADDRIADLEQRLAYAVEQLQTIRKAAAEAAELTAD